MPRKIFHIELTDVAKLAALQCTDAELAAYFECSPKKWKKILAEFPEVRETVERGRESGKTSLRRKQFRLASTSASMAIHLGKNLLGQSDTTVLDLNTNNGESPLEGVDLNTLDQNERDQLRAILTRARKSESGS